jgi:hypothetical protein
MSTARIDAPTIASKHPGLDFGCSVGDGDTTTAGVSGVAEIAGGSDADFVIVATGRPQFGQLTARSDTSRPQSGHFSKAIGTPMQVDVVLRKSVTLILPEG